MLLQLSSKAKATDVLIIWDTQGSGTLTLQNSLQSAGFNVELSQTVEYQYNGANPSPDNYQVVIHLNGTTYSQDMPTNGQNALVGYVQNGGFFIHQVQSIF